MIARALAPALLIAATAVAAGPAPIPTDRQWDELPSPAAEDPRATLAAATDRLEGATLELAGVPIDRHVLADLAAVDADAPIKRAAREMLRRPVIVEHLLYLLDDWVAARGAGHDAPTVWIHGGRARRAGLLLGPAQVFDGAEAQYGGGELALTRPPEPADLAPAPDGAPLGPRWSARFENPQTEQARLEALAAHGAAGFADRIADLLSQLRRQGAEAVLASTIRHRERGYLMYGAFILSRAQTQTQVAQRAAKLDRLKRTWGLDIAIQWRHPAGWRTTVDRAQAMAEAYNVVYASQAGARSSRHYDGRAADFVALGLPRKVTLRSPAGEARRTFDLSDPSAARDLNLTPAMIDWIEQHFDLAKLRSDYPHWIDARAP
jgi:hypothetical protein